MRRLLWPVVLASLSMVAGCAGQRAAGPVFPGPEVTVSASAPVDAGPAGDQPPNYADNNGWKQRHELSAAEQKEGDQLVARIEPVLAELRAAGDFTPESTRRALLGLGLEAGRVGVTAMRQPSWMDSVPPGAVFEVRFGAAGCVTGDVRPERLLVHVSGAAAEFGCLEPYTH
jgi:hypothetical protein